VQAHEQAQVLRLDGNLMDSRTTLKACSVEACPAVVQRDCVQWLDEVSAQIPTVVFEAITETGAAQKVTVKAGDQTLTQALDGRPLEMNPGYYEFHFEISGRAPKVSAVLLKQGEKNRLVTVDFREPLPSTLQPALSMQDTALARPASRTESRPVPGSVYALGGLALVGAAAATVLGISTRTKEKNAYDDCAPRCSEERVDDIQQWALATDVSIGVALVAAVSAVVLYIRRPVVSEQAPNREAPTVRGRVALSADVGWAGIEGSF
jgi:hypothetical protein